MKKQVCKSNLLKYKLLSSGLNRPFYDTVINLSSVDELVFSNNRRYIVIFINLGMLFLCLLLQLATNYNIPHGCFMLGCWISIKDEIHVISERKKIRENIYYLHTHYMILKKVICYVFSSETIFCIPGSYSLSGIGNEISPLVFLWGSECSVVCLQNAKIGESHQPETGYMMGS